VHILTDGMLLQNMLQDPLLSMYNVVMVDDCHERSLNTDLVLSLLKKIIVKRPDLKVIISSASL
jgi:HrpA-like RNA helicase